MLAVVAEIRNYQPLKLVDKNYMSLVTIDVYRYEFMLQLTAEEFKNMKSQIVISCWGGARRLTPYAFTEQGVAMLSSILRSKRAVMVNIEVIRTFQN
jgi:ORF6N domain